MSETPVIQLEDITYTYENHIAPSIQDIHFSVKQGEWLWITGPGGSGKTTICGLLCGILQSSPDGELQGDLLVDGCDMTKSTVRDLAGQVGIVFQDPESGLIHEYVEDELAFGPENLRVSTDEIEKRIDDALTAIDLPGMRTARMNQLSGGQKQRISIASVMTMQPKILVLDDAAVNLDAPATEKLLASLQELQRKGHTIITTSSRLTENCPADRVMIVMDGRMIANGETEEVISQYKDPLIQMGCLPKPTKIVGSMVSEGEESLKKQTPNPSSHPVIQVKQLSYDYHSQQEIGRESTHHSVLNKLSVDLYKGDFLAVLGPNGSGKTTFGKLLAGLLSPPVDSILIHGCDLRGYSVMEHAQIVGYLFQNPEHQFVAETVLEECIFGLLARNGLKLHSKEASEKIEQMIHQGEEWLRKFGLYHQRSRHPFHLSTLEKQLLNLASVLILQPDVIVLDEPTAGLDYSSADQLMSYCADYAKQGKSIVMITHDVHTVRRWANRKLVF